jgi:hypothetical protein
MPGARRASIKGRREAKKEKIRVVMISAERNTRRMSDALQQNGKRLKLFALATDLN